MKQEYVDTTDDYYYGDPQPPQEAGYGEFVAWQEAQRSKRRRPKGKATPHAPAGPEAQGRWRCAC